MEASDGTTAPKKYDGSATPAALGGSPPAGKFAAIYKTRVYLAGTAANPNRVFASPTPDIEATWDTSNSYLDADYPVTGLAPLANQLLVFSAGHLERFIGTTTLCLFPKGERARHEVAAAQRDWTMQIVRRASLSDERGVILCLTRVARRERG